MTYDPTIPQADVSPANQQAGIQTNFAQFATIFANNHTALNASKQGQHESIILQKQTSDPAITGNNDVIYCKDATSNAGTQPQLFLRIPKFLPNQFNSENVENTPVQLTYNSVNTAGPVYQSFLPGGYIFYFGTISDISSAITLSPAPTKILIALAIPNSLAPTASAPATNCSTQVLTTSTFKIFSTNLPASYSFSWMAIAKA